MAALLVADEGSGCCADTTLALANSAVARKIAHSEAAVTGRLRSYTLTCAPRRLLALAAGRDAGITAGLFLRAVFAAGIPLLRQLLRPQEYTATSPAEETLDQLRAFSLSSL